MMKGLLLLLYLTLLSLPFVYSQASNTAQEDIGLLEDEPSPEEVEALEAGADGSTENKADTLQAISDNPQHPLAVPATKGLVEATEKPLPDDFEGDTTFRVGENEPTPPADPNTDIPEPSSPAPDGTTLTPGEVGIIPPTIISQLSPSHINSIADRLTIFQVRAIPLSTIPLLSNNTIRLIIDKMTLLQIDALTIGQVQALATAEIEKALALLPNGAQRDRFFNKLSDVQLIRYVQRHPNLGDLPPEVLERYLRLINGELDVTVDPAANAIITRTTMTNNDIPVILSSIEGDFSLAVTQFGFDFTTVQGASVQLENPLDQATLTFDMPAGSQVSVALTQANEFEIKLSQFVTVHIAPPNFGTLTLYSKNDNAVAVINQEGEYTFAQAILTFTSPEFTEFIDTDDQSTVSLHQRAGFLCALLSYNANYTLQQEESHSVLSQTQPMYLCVRKGAYIEQDFYTQTKQYFSTSGISYNLLDVVDGIMDFTAALLYTRNDEALYYSLQDTPAINTNGPLHIQQTQPLLLFNDGSFSIQENEKRLLYFLSEPVLQMLTEYKTLHPSDITFNRAQPCSFLLPCKEVPTSFIQRSATKVTVYDQSTSIPTTQRVHQVMFG